MTEQDAQRGQLWHGRFASGPAEELMAFTASLPVDQVLWHDDITGSRAHVNGLERAKLLSSEEAEAVRVALSQVHDEFSSGQFSFVPSDEDIHTAIERRVTEIAGSAGAKLHTARSRNDQVATALRLWTRRELTLVAGRVLDLIDVLVASADAAGWGKGSIYMPGYTHLQRAQPVQLSHHLAAHAWSLLRDTDRIFSAIDRGNISPLGAGALAGSSLPIDPSLTAKEMGFRAAFVNSLDAVSDRDFVAEALFNIALLGVHLSRLGEEWVLWTTEEFGFAKLDDAYSTGSSMLPQKKNADIAELARGKSGRFIGNLTGLLTTLKGLPLAYNRDLQEDKEPLFDSVNQVKLALSALSGMISTATFNKDRMQLAADDQLMAATDLAEWMVRKGIPFRQAHAHVGELVQQSIKTGKPLHDLALASELFGKFAAELIAPGVGVSMRTSPGGAGPVPGEVQRQQLELAIEVARGEWEDLLAI
jgi:argininosuccinate lyase